MNVWLSSERSHTQERYCSQFGVIRLHAFGGGGCGGGGSRSGLVEFKRELRAELSENH